MKDYGEVPLDLDYMDSLIFRKARHEEMLTSRWIYFVFRYYYFKPPYSTREIQTIAYYPQP